MADDREVELKLEVPARGLLGLQRSALLRRARRRESRELVSVYYDTDKQKLRRRGFSLRVRRIGDRHVQTIKRTGVSNQIALDRDEWETEIGGDDPDLNAARHSPLKSVLSKNTRRAMKPVFETRVLRTTYPMRTGGSEVEVSVDKGRVHAGKKSAVLCEVELELKRGHSLELFRLAQRLADNIPVEVALKSKSQRGYELVNGDAPSPVKSVSASLSRKLTTEAAFKSVARACLHHLLLNVPVLRAGNAEGLHQVRVSLRVCVLRSLCFPAYWTTDRRKRSSAS
jgi:inorganic triphosphatase YgiF